jgi:K+-transporting ATPase ATPase C chain
MRLPTWLNNHLAALRALLVLTVLLGVLYPLAVLLAAQIPGLKDRADGSLVGAGGVVIGSRLIGQSFTDADGKPLARYFQSRPSAGGYDPLVTGASNLGPESVVDAMPDPAVPGDSGTPSLLTQVCARSLAVGELEGVDGRRPYCTADGVGAVLSVHRTGGLTGPVTRAVSVNQACPATPFLADYEGVAVECATPGEDHSGGVLTPIHTPIDTPIDTGGPAMPTVPADAVTASGSGLDPNISPEYAALQAPRVARERGVDPAAVTGMIGEHTAGRFLGFVGEPTVNVLELNMELDQRYPLRG